MGSRLWVGWDGNICTGICRPTISAVCCPTATLLELLPQLDELDVSWNELIGGCLKALTSHLHHAVGLRALRLCGCRLSADDVASLGGSRSLRTRLQGDELG